MTRPTVLVVTDRTDAAAPDAAPTAAFVSNLGTTISVAVDADDALRQVVAHEFDLVALPAEPVGMCFHELAEAIAATCRAAHVATPSVWRVEATVLAGGTASDSSDDEPAIDLATLSALEADIGDRGFVFDTVVVYLTELPDRMAAMSMGLVQSNADDVKAVAHSLKSSSTMLGAHRLAALCAQLERQASDGSGFGDVDEVTARLTAEVAAAETGLRDYLAS